MVGAQEGGRADKEARARDKCGAGNKKKREGRPRAADVEGGEGRWAGGGKKAVLLSTSPQAFEQSAGVVRDAAAAPPGTI